MKLKDHYDRIVFEYIKLFAMKHELEFDGEIISLKHDAFLFGDKPINLWDIMLDIDNDIPINVFFTWYDETSERNTNKEQIINYETYSKGFTYEHLDKGVK